MRAAQTALAHLCRFEWLPTCITRAELSNRTRRPHSCALYAKSCSSEYMIGQKPPSCRNKSARTATAAPRTQPVSIEASCDQNSGATRLSNALGSQRWTPAPTISAWEMLGCAAHEG